MGRFNFRAQRVHETVTGLFEAGSLTRKPVWYGVVGSIQPPALLTRTQPIRHAESGNSGSAELPAPRRTGQGRKGGPGGKTRKASKMFRPVEMRYEEDALRREFYKDHPWELARPRIVTEEHGVNGTEVWDGIRQKGLQMSGESVVQRQLYLMDQHNLTQTQAYDVARSEFYAARLQEDVERRVAREEALHYGAFFGASRLEVGAQLEHRAFEDWKVWADGIVTDAEQLRTAGNARTDASSSPDSGSSALDAFAEEEAELEDSNAGGTNGR